MMSTHTAKGIDFFVRDGQDGVWDRGVIGEVVDGDCYRIGGWLPSNPVVVLDVGGYIGAFSRWVGIRVPSAKIIAFEPVAANLQLLKMNTQDMPNVTVIDAALGDRNGTVTFVEGNGNPGGGGVLWQASGGATPCRDVAEVIADVGYVDCLKLDCEGGEFAILERIRSMPGGIRAHVGCVRAEVHASTESPEYKRFMDTLRQSFPFTAEQPLGSGLGLAFGWR